MSSAKTIVITVAITSTILVGAFIGVYFGFLYEPVQQDVALTITKGDTEKNFSLKEIKDLSSSISGYGGYKKTTETIVGPFQYRGVPILSLLDSVGGMTSNDELIATASDFYQIRYTKSMVDGKVTTYNESGDDLGLNDVTMVLLYEEIGETSLNGGPLRLGYISDEGYLTDGHLWVKEVVDLKVQELETYWEVKLYGLVNYTLDSSYFEAAMNCPSQDTSSPHRISYPLQEGDRVNNYEGMALWLVIGMIDGYNDWDHSFNDSLVGLGYQITLKSKNEGVDDVILSFDDVARDNSYILAAKRNSVFLDDFNGPLMLLGDSVPLNQITAGINEIWLSLAS